MQKLYHEMAQYFDLLAAATGANTAAEVTFLESILRAHQAQSVLDIACGTGRHSVALAKSGFDVTGIDYAPELLKVARAKENLPNLRFVQQDVTNLTLNATFDAAICMWTTFGELPYERLLDGLPAVLKSGGLFVIDTTYFPVLPTQPASNTYSNLADGTKIITRIDESFSGKTRTREITYEINGQTIHDHSEMDMYTEDGYVTLMGAHGFNHLESYYDYQAQKSDKPKRIQMVFAR